MDLFIIIVGLCLYLFSSNFYFFKKVCIFSQCFVIPLGGIISPFCPSSSWPSELFCIEIEMSALFVQVKGIHPTGPK